MSCGSGGTMFAIVMGVVGLAVGVVALAYYKRQAEAIARALDQLGYLVREGIVRLNVIARFYSYPTLKCWYELSPYVAAVRTARNQPGHMWEWENLVKKVIEGARTDTGLWKGTLEHDNLKEYA